MHYIHVGYGVGPYLFDLCFVGELALDIGSVGRNENDNDSHYLLFLKMYKNIYSRV